VWARVVLTHVIPPIGVVKDDLDAFMAGMAALYSGPIRVAHDTARVPVTRRG
jgi:hypothetical protein